MTIIITEEKSVSESGEYYTVNSKDLFQPQSADSALWPLELIWPFVGPFCQVGPYRPQ